MSPRDADFETGPLQLRFRCEQFENIDAAADVDKRRKDAAETAVNKGVFALRHPPRFVILLSMAHAVLIDREKWSDSRLQLRLRRDFRPKRLHHDRRRGGAAPRDVALTGTSGPR